MAAQKEMIRIRLKAYDHQLIDQSAEKILYVSVDRCARSAPAGLCAGVSYEPE